MQIQSPNTIQMQMRPPSIKSPTNNNESHQMYSHLYAEPISGQYNQYNLIASQQLISPNQAAQMQQHHFQMQHIHNNNNNTNNNSHLINQHTNKPINLPQLIVSPGAFGSSGGGGGGGGGIGQAVPLIAINTSTSSSANSISSCINSPYILAVAQNNSNTNNSSNNFTSSTSPQSTSSFNSSSPSTSNSPINSNQNNRGGANSQSHGKYIKYSFYFDIL